MSVGAEWYILHLSAQCYTVKLDTIYKGLCVLIPHCASTFGMYTFISISSSSSSGSGSSSSSCTRSRTRTLSHGSRSTAPTHYWVGGVCQITAGNVCSVSWLAQANSHSTGVPDNSVWSIAQGLRVPQICLTELKWSYGYSQINN